MVVNMIFPGAHLEPGACALVAMAAVFGAASRSTFAFIIFAFEITRDYNAILPLMLVCVIADGVGLIFMRHSIMTEKLARRGLRVPSEYEADPFQQVAVQEVMDLEVPTVPSTMRVAELADHIAMGEPLYLRHHALPILDEEGRLAGIITRGDVLRALESEPAGNRSVLDAGNDAVIVAYPDETLHDALDKMLHNDIGRLPVVSREEKNRLVGYLGRARLLEGRVRKLEEESVREPGWIARRRGPAVLESAR
jgi:CBS domain-containing protein